MTHKMNQKLKELAIVRAGLTVRKATRDAETRLYAVVQIRNVSQFGTLDLRDMAEMQVGGDSSPFS